jgi:hypothetical protein
VAKQEFLDNFRAARNLFVHNASLDPESQEHRIARGALWLVPKSVAGFDVDDFRELGPDRQQELADGVREFLAVAKQVTPSDTATADQLTEARAAFGKIAAILAPYLPTHPEVTRTEEAVQTVEIPDWVANWEFELTSDWQGEPAVLFTFYVDEQTAPRKQLSRLSSDLTSKIHRALSAVGIDRWPFPRVRTVFEYKSMSMV